MRERHALERRLRHQAHDDPLTGLGDVGTGYAAMSHLTELPSTNSKLTAASSPPGQGRPEAHLTTAILGLAHGLGLQVVAEGMETAHQADQLSTLGCEPRQGYLFSCALPAGDARRLLIGGAVRWAVTATHRRTSGAVRRSDPAAETGRDVRAAPGSDASSRPLAWTRQERVSRGQLIEHRSTGSAGQPAPPPRWRQPRCAQAGAGGRGIGCTSGPAPFVGAVVDRHPTLRCLRRLQLVVTTMTHTATGTSCREDCRRPGRSASEGAGLSMGAAQGGQLGNRPARWTWRARCWQCGLGLGVGVMLLVAAAPALLSDRSAGEAEEFGSFVVRADPGAVEAVRQQVRERGGRVGRDLPIISGFAAELPTGQVPGVRAAAGVAGLTPNGAVRLTSVDPKLGYDAGTDFGSLYNVTQITGVQSAWKAGYTGKGVDIALVDSGVSEVRGLTSGNVLNGPDLSFESQNSALEHRDTYGHGTHMAGIIVGRDAAASPKAYADPARFVGMAPDARLLSVKVASADGATDVSQVIAGIDWVAQHAHDNGLNVRVLNLSFGTDSPQDYRLDPLAYAAEAAWRSAGLVVVVAGGNDGTDKTVLSDPAMDPYVLAVGAQDPRNTLETSDDTVPDFATRGTSSRHVDLVAPAVHVISTRDPGSYIDQNFPGGRVGTRFFRGSGTSQGAAVVSGAAAVLLQRYPWLTNDQVKKMLMASADPFSGSSSIYRGAGAVNVRKALAAPIPTGGQNLSASGTGTGSLEQARGSAHVQSQGVELAGEQDIFAQPWDGASWAPAALGLRSWDGGSWRGSVWTGTGWTGTSWTASTWAGRSWVGADWTGQGWSGRSWVSHSWSGGGWDGRSWVDSSWAGRSWVAARWASAGWN